MKKILGLSVVAATLLTGAAVAEDMGKMSGDLRVMYIEKSGDATGFGTSNDETGGALSAGANFLYESPTFKNLSFGIGYTAQSNIIEKDTEQNDGVANAFYVEENAHLNQIYAVYSCDLGTIKAGRQVLNTPGASADDVRLTPNTFEAVVLINDKAVSDVTFIGAQVATMQGWDSAGGIGTYVSMTNAALGGGAEANGATVLAAIYGKDGISAQVWSYNILNTTSFDTAGGVAYNTEIQPIMLNYIEVGYTADMGDMSVTVAGQYNALSADIEDITTEAKIKNLDQTAMGAKIDVSMKNGLSAMLAMNSISVDDMNYVGGYTNAWGGYSEFAVADEFWANSFKNREFTTLKGSVGYTMDDLSAKLAITSFSGDDTKGTEETAMITDIIVGYKAATLTYEMQSISGVASAADNDNTILKLSLVKTF